MSLLVKKASKDEKTQLFRIVHDMWPHHPDVDVHTRLRLESIQHLRANWFVGIADNELACGLGVYSAKASFEGSTHKLAMIGAVYTAQEHRKKGYAAKLLKEVIAAYKKDGYELFMLYSDISPSYYERLGFKLKNMKLTEVSAKDNEIAIKGHSLEEYENLIPHHSSMIERAKDYRDWLFKRSEAKLFSNKNKSIYALVGEHEGESYVLESSQHQDLKPFIEQLASELDLASLKYWGELPGLETLDFKAEIPMFHSDSINVDKLIENIELFPIDHV